MHRIEDAWDIGLFINTAQLVHRSVSALHLIEIFSHNTLGTILVLNREIQHVEKWSPLYHEPLVHIPAAFLENLQTVLILGGGSFYAASEALKYRNVREVTMIDYDGELLEIMTRHYPHARACREDPRLKIVVDEAFSTLGNISDKFDLIINDALDLWSPRDSKHDVLARYLNNDGLCSDVIYRHVFSDTKPYKKISAIKSPGLFLSLIFVPEYPGTLHLLTVWGNNMHVRRKSPKIINFEQRQWLRHPEQQPCQYYDPRFLHYYLYLPPYIKAEIGQRKFPLNVRVGSGQSRSSQ